MPEVERLVSEAAGLVEQRLDDLIPSEQTDPKTLHAAIRWSIFAGGKRFRPALVLAVGRAFGAADHELITTAAAIEMIHTYSLIHDDLPSMDDDDLRRGKPTCHVQFGEAAAILAGDALQSLAFQSIADDETLDLTVRVRLISLIAAAAGTPSGMVAGQQLDLDGEGQTSELAEIESIHGKKTGALISAAALAGAVIGRADRDDMERIENFSRHLGLLFQITDDLLDVTESTASLGKTAGKDASVQKATYPSVLGLAAAAERASATAAAARRELQGLSRPAEILGELVDLVSRRKS